MKLVRYAYEATVEVGLVAGDLILRLSTAASPDLCLHDVIDVVKGGPALLERLRAAAASGDLAKIPLSSATLLAPIVAAPRNVFCVGLNYLDHVAEGDRWRKLAAPRTIETPHFFTKPPSTITAPSGAIPHWIGVTVELDYEVELALIIGRPGRNIRAEAAFEHVFGYCVANDVSARDLQRRHGQWFKGKALDGSLPLGPWVVTRDEIPDPAALELTLEVNGERRQHARVSEMIFDIPTLIAQLSAGLRLEAGDIVLTGTPSGAGFAMSPPRFLREGDRVVSTISGIGTLDNTVVAAR